MATKNKNTDKINSSEDGIEYDANGAIKLPNDRFVDPWRLAQSDTLRGVVKEAQRLITNYEPPGSA